jgi:hypothetical protein
MNVEKNLEGWAEWLKESSTQESLQEKLVLQNILYVMTQLHGAVLEIFDMTQSSESHRFNANLIIDIDETKKQLETGFDEVQGAARFLLPDPGNEAARLMVHIFAGAYALQLRKFIRGLEHVRFGRLIQNMEIPIDLGEEVDED